ncbi:hypothetical protein B0H17DRAFT_937368, partial [Mycena rosella]
IGERFSPYVALACLAMATTILIQRNAHVAHGLALSVIGGLHCHCGQPVPSPWPASFRVTSSMPVSPAQTGARIKH